MASTAQADEVPPSGLPAEICSEQILQASAASSPTVAGLPPVREEATNEPLVERPQRVLCTVELFFTDQAGRRLLFCDAVRRRFGGGWALRSSAKARLGMGRHDGYGLGGIPGRWREFYPDRSPVEFGLDADVAVLYADDDAHRKRTDAADSELLRETLGTDWRSLIRACADGSKRL